jgi:hypothetical protein
VGDRFRIASVGETPTHPPTGGVLPPQEKMIGEIELTRVEEKFAVGRVVSKKGEIKRDDKVMEM